MRLSLKDIITKVVHFMREKKMLIKKNTISEYDDDIRNVITPKRWCSVIKSWNGGQEKRVETMVLYKGALKNRSQS